MLTLCKYSQNCIIVIKVWCIASARLRFHNLTFKKSINSNRGKYLFQIKYSILNVFFIYLQYPLGYHYIYLQNVLIMFKIWINYSLVVKLCTHNLWSILGINRNLICRAILPPNDKNVNKKTALNATELDFLLLVIQWYPEAFYDNLRFFLKKIG